VNKSEPELTQYTCKEPIKHDGKNYSIGDPVDMDDDCAERLKHIDAVELSHAVNDSTDDDKLSDDSTDEPISPEERQVEIIKTIGKLENGNDAHWLKDKVTPEVKALNDILKWKQPVTADERNAAMASATQSVE